MKNFHQISEHVSEERVRIVRDQCNKWAEHLIDLSGRNRMLNFRSRKRTLHLELTDQQLQDLLEGKDMPVSKLEMSDQQLADSLGGAETATLKAGRQDAQRESLQEKARELYRTAQVDKEERGIESLYLTVDHVEWRDPEDRRKDRRDGIITPLMLLAVALEPISSGKSRFLLKLQGALEINPVLLYRFNQLFGLSAPSENTDPEISEADRLRALRNWASKLCSHEGLESLQHKRSFYLDTFTFQNMAMVAEMKSAASDYAKNDIVSALAGVSEAARALGGAEQLDSQQAGGSHFDRRSPDAEFLVLDADSSQLEAIEAAQKGKSIVIHGPPGTGKSQTITNLITQLVADGKRILFVAEKKAALDVVKARLSSAKLGHLVLDLHGADVSRKEIAQQVSRSLDIVRTSQPADATAIHNRYVISRDRLTKRANALHSVRPHLGKTIYDLFGERLRLGNKTITKFSREILRELNYRRLQEVMAMLKEKPHLGSIIIGTEDSRWMQVKDVHIDEIQKLLNDMGKVLRRVESRELSALLARLGISGTKDAAILASAGHEMTEVFEIAGRYDGQIWSCDVEQLRVALVPARGGILAHFWAWLTNRAYRTAWQTVRTLAKFSASARQIYSDISSMDGARKAWTAVSSQDWQINQPDVEQLLKMADRLVDELNNIGKYIPGSWQRTPLETVVECLREMLSQEEVAKYIPEARRTKEELISLGLEDFLEEMKENGIPPPDWPIYLYQAWVASAVDMECATDSIIAKSSRIGTDNVLRDFRVADRERINMTAERLRRRHAERVVEAFNIFGDGYNLLKKESQKKGRHLPFRDLLAKTGPLLPTLCPCIMASPLSVSQLLPISDSLFDVVIFDEASQVQPEVAAPALKRASQAIVAGDPHQLPPTNFFSLGDENFADDAEDELQGVESILDALQSYLPSVHLNWHYRSRDERLITYSNHHIYNDRLVTFPGIAETSPVEFVHVPPGPANTDTASSGEEAVRVVDAVIEHARQNSWQSLGVITMGVKHRDRIQQLLDTKMKDMDDMGPFFDPQREERFFIKNIEQVQGDERDVIFIAVGYCPSADGRLAARFGPINQKGGERRLNVACTRAKSRMKVFCSFTHHDLDPGRSSSEGYKYLRGFLEFAATGRALDAQPVGEAVQMNYFEQDIYAAMESRGIKAIPQLGVSGYRIDFAVQHPLKPGKFVLAVECDGASYHSSKTARDRDRLRQQHLENLGWKVYRIWSTHWFHDRKGELDELERVVQVAIRECDSIDGGTGPGWIAANDADNLCAEKPDLQWADGAPRRIGRRPWLPKYNTIDQISDGQLHAVIEWIRSDGTLRVDEEMIQEVSNELGFKRIGPRIRERIASALAAARQ